jgi:hypothetical protein
LNDFPAGISARFLESSRLPPMRIRSALLLLPAALIAVAFACNNNGEGQPCDHNAGGNPSGTDDCQSPLICVVAPNPGAGPGYRCCPPQGTTPTTYECTVPAAGVDASPLPPPADAASGADAPAESGQDAPAESAPEASPPADAAEGGSPADASEGGSPADAAEAGTAEGGPADGTAE